MLQASPAQSSRFQASPSSDLKPYRCYFLTNTFLPLDRLKMYTRLPSIDSRLDAASVRGSSLELEAVCRDEFTVPLLSGSSPLPTTQISAATTTFKASVLRWAPLPVRESRVAYTQRRKKTMRKFSPSETMTMIRKWYRKQADVDRIHFTGESKSTGNCHFCKDCGENHERSRSKASPRLERANKRVRFQELDDVYNY